MYIPEHFKETNPARISALIAGHPFGMLVTAPEGVPFVSHLPFLFERSAGSQGKLLGHMARANPQWQHFSTGSEVLAVFQGPHAYVSPSWYSSPGVPTWNYAVVHLRGKPRLIAGEAELEALLEKLTRVHESPMPSPWEPKLTGERRAKLLDMIVGFEIEVTHIQGKFKLSQNRPLEDQQNVVKALSLSNNQTDTAVAELMSEAIHAEFE
jgi:transcriptional regulator